MIITIFEDSNSFSLSPININHASFELRCGAFTNIERIIKSIKSIDKIQLIVREEISDLISIKFPDCIVNPSIVDKGICLNGRAIWDEAVITSIKPNRSYSNKGLILASTLNEKIDLNNFYSHLDSAILVSEEIPIVYFENIWDGIFLQKEVLENDAHHFFHYKSGSLHPTTIIENGDNIFTGNNVQIGAGVVLDASLGPIIIDDGVFIDIGALIKGPIYIGKKSIINPGSKLRGSISIGPQCKIGGELEDVIIQGYTNKQHDGFLGHSHLGEWINLGANTNNSDLKNNYGLIHLNNNNKIIQTNRQFLGTIMGDFSRTGISTMLNTGTIIGIGANVFGSGFQEKFICSFAWGKEHITELDKFLETIKIMKERRSLTLYSEEKLFITKFYNKIFQK
jgi:UDP-N-acetylglucosamine diphosphorylase/glucosamine-1-phosphate N-acetyltransferase